jgi:hypothetical protein
MPKKWEWPEHDAALFTMDKFFKAQAVVAEAMGKIYAAKLAGTATAEDEAHLKELSAQWIELMQEVGDVQKRLFSGDHVLQPKMN